jgi:hypothetical protein
MKVGGRWGDAGAFRSGTIQDQGQATLAHYVDVGLPTAETDEGREHEQLPPIPSSISISIIISIAIAIAIAILHHKRRAVVSWHRIPSIGRRLLDRCASQQ